jgi:hypothetical protein
LKEQESEGEEASKGEGTESKMKSGTIKTGTLYAATVRGKNNITTELTADDEKKDYGNLKMNTEDVL